MSPAPDDPHPRPSSRSSAGGEGKPDDILEVPPNRAAASVDAAKDPEVAGSPATAQPLTGRQAWWAKWGFEVKLLVALLLPVFVEVCPCRAALFKLRPGC